MEIMACAKIPSVITRATNWRGFHWHLIVPFPSLQTDLYSFRYDQYLVLSTDSLAKDIPNCFCFHESETGNGVKLIPEPQSAAFGLQSYALTVSQGYDAIAYLDRDGNISA
jgi:hypothetical protein